MSQTGALPALSTRPLARAGTKPPRLVDGANADHHLPVRRDQRLASGHDAADEILLGRHHLAEAKIGGGGRAVEFGAGDMALLYPHDAESLGAVGRHAELLA